MNFNQAPYVPGRPTGPPKGGQREPKGTPKGTKGNQRGPKDAQREPKGCQRSQKEPKVGPREAKGAPKSPKGSQRKPKGKDIYQKTPDQPPQRTLCYNHFRYIISSVALSSTKCGVLKEIGRDSWDRGGQKARGSKNSPQEFWGRSPH